MSDEGWKDLANAIILQAVKDFKPAYRRLRRHPNDKVAQNQVRELTKFFCSDYFATLTDLRVSSTPACRRTWMARRC